MLDLAFSKEFCFTLTLAVRLRVNLGFKCCEYGCVHTDDTQFLMDDRGDWLPLIYLAIFPALRLLRLKAGSFQLPDSNERDTLSEALALLLRYNILSLKY